MKLTRWIILLLTSIISVHIYGQDTISIYFEFGSSKIPENQLIKLNDISTKYDLSELDSLLYLGMADTIGNYKSNIKLSEKRARNVDKFCRRILPQNLSSQIIALGEHADTENKPNRRVDIVLFFPQEPMKTVGMADSNDIKKACYNIDYELLHNCHLRRITKRKREFIIIETTIPHLKKEHYYGLTTKNGDFIVKKVRWTTRKTGKLWWSEKRSVCTIPKKSFDTYKIFKTGELPCDTCSESFQEKAEISKEDTCLQIDRFLMENTQYKISFFNDKRVIIRVPREYIDIDIHYFVGCDIENVITWDTKRIGRKKNYYYAKIPGKNNYISNITRMMDCCKYNSESSECDKPIISCKTIGRIDNSFLLHAEIGNHYPQSTMSPYASLGISKEDAHSRVNMLFGSDINLNFYSSLRFQYHFISFPFSALNPISRWQTPTKQSTLNTFGRLYLGTELKTRISSSKNDYLEQNVHIGMAMVNTNANTIIPRIFVQYGIGLDYLKNTSAQLYSILQLGIHVKIAKLNNK